MEWRTMETAPMDGSEVLLFTTCHGICEAWFSAGEWSEDTPTGPAEYSGDVWVCCDDAFQIEVEVGVGPLGESFHGTAIAWAVKPEPPAWRGSHE